MGRSWSIKSSIPSAEGQIIPDPYSCLGILVKDITSNAGATKHDWIVFVAEAITSINDHAKDLYVAHLRYNFSLKARLASHQMVFNEDKPIWWGVLLHIAFALLLSPTLSCHLHLQPLHCHTILWCEPWPSAFLPEHCNLGWAYLRLVDVIQAF